MKRRSCDWIVSVRPETEGPEPEPKSQSQSRKALPDVANEIDLKHMHVKVDNNVPPNALRYRLSSASRTPANMIQFFKRIFKPSQRQRKAQAKEVKVKEVHKGTPATTMWKTLTLPAGSVIVNTLPEEPQDDGGVGAGKEHNGTPGGRRLM